MKHLVLLLVFINLLPVSIQAQGAAYGGRGYAGAADATDAFSGLWNPAALAFLPKRELAYQRNPWLPNFADDMVYQLLGGRYNIPETGTIGAYINYINLGKQERTDDQGDYLGTFRSYWIAFSASFGMKITQISSVGLNAGRIHQHQPEFGAGGEAGKRVSTDFAFDIAYYRRGFMIKRLDLGLSIRNMGGHIERDQAELADPHPTKFALGFKWSMFEKERNGIAIYYDLNKLLVASHPSIDFDGDGIIGGYDKDGNPLADGEYGRNGKREVAHTDPWYLGLITSWYDDWLYGGDIDRDGDGIIDDDEEGNQDDGSFKNELRAITRHMGVEWRFLTHYIARAGMIHDPYGKIREYTLGAGVHFRAFRLDFAYLYGGGSSIRGPMLFPATATPILCSMSLAL